MTRLRAWLSARSDVSWLEVLAALFVVLGILRLPFGYGEAQVLVLVGLVWATLAMARASVPDKIEVAPLDLDACMEDVVDALNGGTLTSTGTGTWPPLIPDAGGDERCPSCGHPHGRRGDDSCCEATIYTTSGARACECVWKP